MPTAKINESDLRRAVESLHGCSAVLTGTVRVVEKFGQKTVWDGIVHVFNICGHANSNICYAWSSPVEGSDRRKFYAVLHIPPITSAQEAVRASIIHDHKQQT